MSYDLYLYTRKGKPSLSRESFGEYFQGECYEQTGDTANYFNDDTGVYFHFTWYAEEEAEEESDRKNKGRKSPPHVHFNMNFFRPHTFGLEAAQILPGFVEQFDLVVNDPQSEGMGEGEFSVEGFLRGWNAGNRFAAGAFAQMRSGGETLLSGNLALPTAINRAYWHWNYYRNQICEDLCDLEEIGVYVPPIWFCQQDGQAKSFTLYPNLVPTAVPKVDYVFMMRDELGGRYKKQSKETPAWVTWDELVVAGAEFEVRTSEDDDEEPLLPHLILYSESYDRMEKPPKTLARWVIDLPDWPGKPQRISPDQILDAELVGGSEPK